MLKEFKEFIARGNVMDMAVGIIMGAAFTGIVKSLVGDVIMPFIGVITAGIDFSNLFIALDGNSYESLAAAQEAGAAVVTYGAFIDAIINFVIVAFAIFLLIKAVNKLKREAEDPKTEDAPPPPADIVLLTEIRDALKTAPAKKAPAKKAAPKKKAPAKKAAAKKK